MTKRGQILLSFALGLALVPLFSLIIPAAFSQDVAVTRGPYMIAAAGDDRTAIWRVDQATGRVSYCIRNTNSLDPALIAGRAPFCSAWSE